MNRTTHDKKSKGAKAMCTSYFQNPISSLHSHFAYKIFNDGLKFRACLVWNKEWYVQKCSFWLNILYSTTPPFLHHCQMPVAGLHWGPFWQSLKHLWSGSACGSVPLADSYRKRWLVSRFVLESHIRFGRTLWTGPSQDSVGYEMQSLVSDSWSVSKMLSLINIAPFRVFCYHWYLYFRILLFHWAGDLWSHKWFQYSELNAQFLPQGREGMPCGTLCCWISVPGSLCRVNQFAFIFLSLGWKKCTTYLPSYNETYQYKMFIIIF